MLFSDSGRPVIPPFEIAWRFSWINMMASFVLKIGFCVAPASPEPSISPIHA